MVKYTSQNTGLLSVENTIQGMPVKIIEEAYMNAKGYWNCKVELPDLSHKLASVGGLTGDLFSRVWGEDTKDWIGKTAEVDIRHSNNTGNDYVVLVPVANDYEANRAQTTPPADDDLPMHLEVPEEKEEIRVEDIPF